MSTHLADRTVNFDPAMVTIFKEIPRMNMYDEAAILPQRMAAENQARNAEHVRRQAELVLAPRAVNHSMPERIAGLLVSVES